ncbi:stage II sporulation protein M [Hyphobacterium sp. HN65]|uniref:Stage II sporulation protein M n=1 Tax=Hyphobacterium lacteum TaxID=3116575 RepID=A0ABU7LQS3_9PROT|nr:stage II sporulation protein M [Hyphobacterium sp. HN65]MEE2525674.1 stage II sporulation protein M [Hyphobacterium sp. HN65]
MSEERARLRSARFREQREADWLALEKLVQKAERGAAARLSFQESQDLARLYRSTATSLSVARDISLDKALLEYLEALVARAFIAVYAPQESLSGIVTKFFARSGPRAMRRSWIGLGLALVTFGLGALIGYALFMQDTEWYYTFIPAELAGGRDPAASTEFLRNALFDDGGGYAAALGTFAAMLFSHNTRVAFMAFAMGIFACVPTFLLSLFNGLTLGTFYALHDSRDLGYEAFGWLSIHGVTEIAAIIIAAGGGFQLGLAVLFPGAQSRKDALRMASKDAIKLALIAALMLFAAGLLEGFGRQLVQVTETRLMVGWGIGALWLAWFLLGGRRRN